MRHNVHYNPVHRPQARPNINTHDQKHCTWCHPPAKSKGAVPPTSWEQQYEPICSNPYALEILTKKTSLSRQAVLNSMMLSSRNIHTTPKMIESSSPSSGEKVTIGKKTKSRRKGNLGWRDYNEEMDLDQARLINWENEQNFERHDVVFEEDWPTEDEVVYGEYLKTVFPEFRAALKERLRKGLVEDQKVVSDQDLRDMGLLYDSNSDSDSEEEQERTLESRGPNTPISRTPYLTPMSFLSDSDLDELWEIVEGRRLPVEMRGEWDIISEF